MDHRLEWAGEQNSMSTGFRWRIDWATDSARDPSNSGHRLGLGWMIDWAADSDPKSMTTGFGWILDSGWAGEPNSMTTGFRVGWRIAPTRTRIRRLLFKFSDA